MFLRSGAKALAVLSLAYDRTSNTNPSQSETSLSTIVFTPPSHSPVVLQLTAASSFTPTPYVPSVGSALALHWSPPSSPVLQKPFNSGQHTSPSSPSLIRYLAKVIANEFICSLGDLTNVQSLLEVVGRLIVTYPVIRIAFLALDLVLWSFILLFTSFLVQVCRPSCPVLGCLLTFSIRLCLFSDF